MNEVITAAHVAIVVTLALAAPAWGATYLKLADVDCTTPAYLHCPDENCSVDRTINQGPVVEMKTRRTYFLDYPCDLRPGEPVTLVLSLHGRGSYGNWQ